MHDLWMTLGGACTEELTEVKCPPVVGAAQLHFNNLHLVVDVVVVPWSQLWQRVRADFLLMSNVGSDSCLVHNARVHGIRRLGDDRFGPVMPLMSTRECIRDETRCPGELKACPGLCILRRNRLGDKARTSCNSDYTICVWTKLT